MKKFRMILLIVLAFTLVFALCACSHEHQFTTKVDKEATCTEAGVSHDECSLCRERTEDKEIPPLGHDFQKDEDGKDVWSFDASGHWHQCLRCGNKIDKTGEIGQTAHTLNSDFECTECSYAKFEYEKSGEDYILTKYNGSETDVVIPEKYSGKTVVGIGEGVFSLNNFIQTITIPAGVKSIGRDAFSGASKLATVKAASLDAWLDITFANYAANPMHVANEIYFGQSKFEGALNVPTGKTTINEYAFYGFGSLTSVTIPDSVKSIGYRAFEGAFKQSAALTVNVNSLETWCAIEFSKGKTDMDKCSANPLSPGATLVVDGTPVTERLDLAGIGKVGAYAFFGYDKITSVTCGAAELGEYAFANCTKLQIAQTSADIISTGLFKGCTALDSVTLENTTSVGTSAFEGCEKLASVALPDTLKTIGEKAFEGCSALATVSGATALDRVGESAFYNTKLFELASGETVGQVYVGKVFVGLKGKMASSGADAGVLEIEDGTVSIADGALANAANLKSVKLPSTLKYIGKNAMKYTGIISSKLENIDLGGTTEIAEGAFSGSALVRIQLTSTLQKIGANAFEGCSSLKEVYVSDINALLGIEFSNAQANPLSLSKALYLGMYDPSATPKPTATTLIAIPDGTTEIGAYTFSGLSNVASVVLPAEVKTIGKSAFEGCSALRNVYYKGTTEEQYKTIQIADGSIGGASAKVYYFSAERPETAASAFWNYYEGAPTRWDNIPKE